MPRAAIERHELCGNSPAIDESVCRNSNTFQVRKRRIDAAVEAIREELLDVVAAESSRRQADAVNDEQNDIVRICTLIAIRRRAARDAFEPMIRADLHAHLAQLSHASCRKDIGTTRDTHSGHHNG